DDGTYVATDAQGAYHFTGVRPGTHVVQLDVATLPSHLEAVPCSYNTRLAGSGISQFVEAGGGALWRADFCLQRRGARVGEVGVSLSLAQAGGRLQHQVGIDVGKVAIERLRAMVMLPAGSSYVAGSATLDG